MKKRGIFKIYTSLHNIYYATFIKYSCFNDNVLQLISINQKYCFRGCFSSFLHWHNNPISAAFKVVNAASSIRPIAIFLVHRLFIEPYRNRRNFPFEKRRQFYCYRFDSLKIRPMIE